MSGFLKRAADYFSSNGILALGAFLISVNLASGIFYHRWDMSDGNIYSVSEASKRILRSLNDPILVKVYFSRDLPQPYATHGDYLRDLLRAYKAEAGRNFEYKIVRYSNEEDLRREALMQGIAPVQMTYIAKDKYEVKDGFMGLVLLHGDKREVIPVLRDLDGLEYDLTSRIKKLAAPTPRVVGVLDGKGTRGLPEDLEKALRENYELRRVRLEDASDFLRPPQTLLVIGPQENFSEADLARLEQLFLRGTALALLLDTRSVDIEGGSFFARPLNLNLERLLNNWGVSLERSFVMDLQNQNLAIQQQAGPYVINNIVNYPLIPLVTQLNTEHPAVKDLDQLVMPFVSPISTLSVTGAEISMIARSTKLSWSKKDVPSLSPLANFSPEDKDPRGPFNLAVSIRGKFNALFKNAPAGAIPYGWVSAGEKESRAIVTGTSRFIDPQISAHAPSQTFLLNAVDWLSEDADLIAIRSRGLKIRPFVINPGYWGRQVIKIMSLFLMPCLIALLALWQWKRRRAWKAALKQNWGQAS